VSFSFDSVEYGSGCPGDVYGFSWCLVDMVLYLAVDIWLSLVPPGLVVDMCLSYASQDLGRQYGLIIHLAGIGVDMYFSSSLQDMVSTWVLSYIYKVWLSSS